MGVRQRAKTSPPSTPGSSVYSGSEPSQGSQDDLLKARRNVQRPTESTSHLLLLSLFVTLTISSFSFFVSFTADRRYLPVRSLDPSHPIIISPTFLRNARRTTTFPRLVFLQGTPFDAVQSRVGLTLTMLPPNATLQPVPSSGAHPPDCVPLADWMTDSYPNCNNFHEMSFPDAVYWNTTTTTALSRRDRLTKLGRGWFRVTWRWDRSTESIVLKTLRLEREFLYEYFDLHNRDALAMERLTASPHVVDVYGYCGQSAINELADFPIEGMQYLEKLSRRMRGMYSHQSMLLRLGIAISIARGLADVHRAGGDGRPLMTHYDINPRNVALFAGARAKVNDFNIAEFMHYNPQTNESCGFPSRMHAPWWRSPEEVRLDQKVLLDEKVDVYSLGATLFHLFTSFSPRGKMTVAREEMVREWVISGRKPTVLPVLQNSTDPIAVTFREVLDRCYEKDPSQRPSADEIATILESTLKREQDAVQQEKSNANAEEPKMMRLSSPNSTESEDVDEGTLERKG